MIYKDYCMAIFLSHPILARGCCISSREPSDSRADTHQPRANIGCDTKIAILWFLYHRHIENIKETIKPYCDEWLLLPNRFVSIYFISNKLPWNFAPAVCIPSWSHTCRLKLNDTYRTSRQNRRWLTERGVI